MYSAPEDREISLDAPLAVLSALGAVESDSHLSSAGRESCASRLATEPSTGSCPKLSKLFAFDNIPASGGYG